MNLPLYYQIVKAADLNETQIQRMFQLMASYYVAQEAAVFRADLAKKQYVVVLRTDEDIQGFSTVAINPAGTGTDQYQVYFSGDTILHPDYWGTQELVKGFFHLVSSLHRQYPDKRLYWFLISKGHRTYMYLPLFFKQYYPGVAGRQDDFLAPVLNEIAMQTFGPYWNPDTGIIHIPNDQPMVDALKEAAYKKQEHNEHIQFFLERNPDFETGAELACLVDLSPENFLPLAERCYRQGLRLDVVV